MFRLEKLVGKRFEDLQSIESEMSKLLKTKVHCIESESNLLENTDYMIDYELEYDDEVYTLFYLKGRGKNKYYITEV